MIKKVAMLRNYRSFPSGRKERFERLQATLIIKEVRIKDLEVALGRVRSIPPVAL